ncbi:MAG: 23S rRNA (adenine(2503)-C(2))-methyltransferase RlmN [Planctomycetia bacterium]|nr:23S rRNA (adenine(2503)-C(2))-methyltransferase RlmN [Planctomycetia bacterium]
MKKSIYELSAEEKISWLKSHGHPSFRATQLSQWALKPGITSFQQMKNLPTPLRQQLEAEFCLRNTQMVTHLGSPDDSAEKFLLRLSDGSCIETVLLHNDKGEHTVCVSTQVGCAMKCVFCASGMNGLVRNLSAHEILEQFLFVADHISVTHQSAGTANRLSHAVIMGMGEPLANLPNLLAALKIVSAKDGLGISARKITISTAGLPDGIRLLATIKHPYHLAISLHAPSDSLRNELMPINRKYGIHSVLDAATYYFHQTGRRVTYEYILIADVNDSKIHARQLCSLLKNQNALINLIPFNPVESLDFRSPSQERIAQFSEILKENGLSSVIRHRKGEKLEAACGQLRLHHLPK